MGQVPKKIGKQKCLDFYNEVEQFYQPIMKECRRAQNGFDGEGGPVECQGPGLECFG